MLPFKVVRQVTGSVAQKLSCQLRQLVHRLDVVQGFVSENRIEFEPLAGLLHTSVGSQCLPQCSGSPVWPASGKPSVGWRCPRETDSPEAVHSHRITFSFVKRTLEEEVAEIPTCQCNVELCFLCRRVLQPVEASQQKGSACRWKHGRDMEISKALIVKSWTDTDVNWPRADTSMFLLFLIVFIINYLPCCAWETLTDNSHSPHYHWKSTNSILQIDQALSYNLLS